MVNNPMAVNSIKISVLNFNPSPAPFPNTLSQDYQKGYFSFLDKQVYRMVLKL